MNVSGIILAGGKGERLKSITHDKVMLRIGAGAVISWSVRVFNASGIFRDLVITYRDDQQKEEIQKELNQVVNNGIPVTWVKGGERRQDSVLNALKAIRNDTDCVFIHDGARPFVTDTDLTMLLGAVHETGAAALAQPVTDTIKRANCSNKLEALELEDLQRSLLYAMETPQVFRYETILKCYQNIAKGRTVTDCIAAYNEPVTLVISEQNNLKITTPKDVELANFLIHTGSIKQVFELAYT